MRPSRCLDSANAPQALLWAVIDGDPKYVVNEMIAATKSVVPVRAQVDALALIRALIGRVEQCKAVDPDDVVPVARHSSLWELRLNVRAYRFLLRLYVAELPELPNDMVVLHAHVKDLGGGSAEEVRRLQNESIDEAIRRFNAGKADYWSLWTPPESTPE